MAYRASESTPKVRIFLSTSYRSTISEIIHASLVGCDIRLRLYFDLLNTISAGAAATSGTSKSPNITLYLFSNGSTFFARHDLWQDLISPHTAPPVQRQDSGGPRHRTKAVSACILEQ